MVYIVETFALPMVRGDATLDHRSAPLLECGAHGLAHLLAALKLLRDPGQFLEVRGCPGLQICLQQWCPDPHDFIEEVNGVVGIVHLLGSQAGHGEGFGPQYSPALGKSVGLQRPVDDLEQSLEDGDLPAGEGGAPDLVEGLPGDVFEPVVVDLGQYLRVSDTAPL